MSVERVYEINSGRRCAVCEYPFETPYVAIVLVPESGARVHRCCWNTPDDCIHTLLDQKFVGTRNDSSLADETDIETARSEG